MSDSTRDPGGTPAALPEEIERLLNLELDGRLEDSERNVLLKHLAHDARVATERVQLAQVVGAMRSEGAVSVPEGLRERILSGVSTPQPTLFARFGLARFGAIAAALLVLAVVGWRLGGIDDSPVLADATRIERSFWENDAPKWRSFGAEDALLQRILAVRRDFAQATESDPLAEREAIRALLPAEILRAWNRSEGRPVDEGVGEVAPR